MVYFLDVEKYPPSLQFLLMTIGPALLLLSWLDRSGKEPFIKKLTNPFLVYGRVPMFFYILHLYVIHLLAIAMAYIFRQPVDWALARQLLDEQHPGELWSRPLLYLHDVALNGSDAVLPLLLVRKAEAEAQTLVVKLSLTAVGVTAGKL